MMADSNKADDTVGVNDIVEMEQVTTFPVVL
jgi:hypothetical protein